MRNRTRYHTDGNRTANVDLPSGRYKIYVDGAERYHVPVVGNQVVYIKSTGDEGVSLSPASRQGIATSRVKPRSH